MKEHYTGASRARGKSIHVSILRAYPWERSELRLVSSSSRRWLISCREERGKGEDRRGEGEGEKGRGKVS